MSIGGQKLPLVSSHNVLSSLPKQTANQIVSDMWSNNQVYEADFGNFRIMLLIIERFTYNLFSHLLDTRGNDTRYFVVKSFNHDNVTMAQKDVRSTFLFISYGP